MPLDPLIKHDFNQIESKSDSTWCASLERNQYCV